MLPPGIWSAFEDLSCSNGAVCEPQDALMFTVAYLAGSALLNVLVHLAIAPVLRRTGALEAPGDNGRMVITRAAVDLTSIIQFVLWIPLGFGVFQLTPFYLFAIPTIHEVYDLLYLWLYRGHGFTKVEVRFVVHHLLSPLLRVCLAVAMYASAPPSSLPQLFGLALLMYCCSIFLITQNSFEPLLFGARESRGRALFRTGSFVLARMSHFLVYVATVMTVARADGGNAVLFVPVGTILFLAIEYFSVINGWPRVRAAWVKARLAGGRRAIAAA